MAEMPKEVEVNVVMGAQLRAIVRSALLHVRNKVSKKQTDVQTTNSVLEEIDKELAKWPMSTMGEPDHLPAWLEETFSLKKEGVEYSEGYWEFKAAAVRRAVGKGRLRPYEKSMSEKVRTEILLGIGQIQQRHQEIGDLLQEYKKQGQPLVSVDQVFNIMTGVAKADQYQTALQVLPTGVDK